MLCKSPPKPPLPSRATNYFKVGYLQVIGAQQIGGSEVHTGLNVDGILRSKQNFQGGKAQHKHSLLDTSKPAKLNH